MTTVPDDDSVAIVLPADDIPGPKQGDWTYDALEQIFCRGERG